MTLAASTVQALSVMDPHSLLTSFGLLGVAVVLFAETGLLIGFFLPGDSLLFTAGVLAATAAGTRGHLPLAGLLIVAPVGAIVGAQVGYLIGLRAGPPLLRGGRRERLAHGVERSEHFLARYGYGKAIVLARFVPVVRTVLNPLCGITRVPLRTFTLWQVVGGVVWTVGVILAGYALGSSIHNVDRYLLPIIAVIIVVSLVPVGLELLRARRVEHSDVS
jgi:membrane-associated protein